MAEKTVFWGAVFAFGIVLIWTSGTVIQLFFPAWEVVIWVVLTAIAVIHGFATARGLYKDIMR